MSVMTAAAGSYRLMNAVSDAVTGDIPLLLSGAAAGCGLFFSYGTGRTVSAVTAAVLPGLCLLLFSLFTGGGIGAGDGVVVSVLGLFEEADILLAECAAGLLAAAFAAFLMLASGRKKTEAFPLVPFLAGGFIAVHLLQR